MLKLQAKSTLSCGQLFSIKLQSSSLHTLAQLVYLFEHEGYLSTTFCFYDRTAEVPQALLSEELDLGAPFMIATVDVDPLKKWHFLGAREVEVDIKEIQSKLSPWGWYRHAESGLFGTLECYFGIFPWDMLVGSSSLENLKVDKRPSPHARPLSEFTIYEIDALGLRSVIENAGRLGELKEVSDA